MASWLVMASQLLFHTIEIQLSVFERTDCLHFKEKRFEISPVSLGMLFSLSLSEIFVRSV